MTDNKKGGIVGMLAGLIAGLAVSLGYGGYVGEAQKACEAIQDVEVPVVEITAEPATTSSEDE